VCEDLNCALKQVKWLVDWVGMKIVDVEFSDVNGGSVTITTGV
jgi:NDP-4-keto-2,6-dideoxyhexose 3-C-methyltransferase